MAHPYHHAVSSARKWGGSADSYVAIHQFFDQTKAAHGDFRHRAILHNTFGVYLAEQVFGTTIDVTVAVTCSACGERLKVKDDGTVPSKVRHIISCGDPEFVPEVKRIPTRWVGEQHVIEDMGRLVALNEWIECIKPEPWMNKPVKLSRVLERDDRQQRQEVNA